MNPHEGFEVCAQRSEGELRWRLTGPDATPVQGANDFLKVIERRGLSPATQRTYAYDLLWAYRWMAEKTLPPEEIDAEDLLDFIGAQHRLGRAASTINRRLGVLQRLVEKQTGQLPELVAWQSSTPSDFRRGPRSGSLRVKVPKRVVRPLSDQEVLEFFKSLRTRRDRSMMMLMWGVGMRADEVLRLRLGDIDRQHMAIIIHGKGNKERVMPLRGMIAEELFGYIDLERPRTSAQNVFVVWKGCRRGQPMGYAALRRIFRYHRKLTGITNANPHRFRHAFATAMVRSGVPLATLSVMMGHMSPRTTMRYVQLHDQDLRQAYDKARRLIDQEESPQDPSQGPAEE